jgi:hypothetical protein
VALPTPFSVLSYVDWCKLSEFPTIFHLAMKGSAVACEYVFSSGETDTARQIKISPELMEALQILNLLWRNTISFLQRAWTAE